MAKSEIVVLKVSFSFSNYDVYAGNGYLSDFDYGHAVAKVRNKFLHIGGWWSMGIKFKKQNIAVRFMKIVEAFLKKEGYTVYIVKEKRR